jgi:hypothetical protein
MRSKGVEPVVIDISKEPPTLGIGIVGWGWMGQVHARAYANCDITTPTLHCNRVWLLLRTTPRTAG